MPNIKIVEVYKDTPISLGYLKSGQISVGRDPQSGIPIQSQAVSFHHGVFSNFKHYWFFQDLGSTNGSILNGKKIEPGFWKLIKPGDFLQLADRFLFLDFPESTFNADQFGLPHGGATSIIVFKKNGEFYEEIALTETGNVMTIGGQNSDLLLPVAHSYNFSLVFHKQVLAEKNEECCFIQVSPNDFYSVYLNNNQLGNGRFQLYDGDEVFLLESGRGIEQYLFEFMYCDFTDFFSTASEKLEKIRSSLISGEYTLPHQSDSQLGARSSKSNLQEIVNLEDNYEVSRKYGSLSSEEIQSLEDVYAKIKSSNTPLFGSEPRYSSTGIDQTIVFDTNQVREDFSSTESRPSHRGFPQTNQATSFFKRSSRDVSRYSLKTLEGKLIVFTGICLFLSVLCLIIWLFSI
jgi:hypothetical protein